MKYLIDKVGKLLVGIAIENVSFQSDLFEIIETGIEPTHIVNKWNGNGWDEIATDIEVESFAKSKIPTEISRAEFIYGLKKHKITRTEVLLFIQYYTSGDVQDRCYSLFEDASYFEYNNPLLNEFVPLFNQYLQSEGKEAINLDSIFASGITLNQ